MCKEIYYDSKPAACTSYKYALGCDKQAGYICGYDAGEVIETTKAYGGSNYVNTGKALTYEEKSGVREGKGALQIEAVHVGFVEENLLRGVHAPDKAAPDVISPDSVKIRRWMLIKYMWCLTDRLIMARYIIIRQNPTIEPATKRSALQIRRWMSWSAVCVDIIINLMQKLTPL